MRTAQKSLKDNNLEDLGLSSIDRVELMSALEDRFQVDLDEAQFAAATTVSEIEKCCTLPGLTLAQMPPRI